MRANEFMNEAIEWQGNRGAEQARYTDHTIDEARQYVKQNYPRNKTYTIRRLEPGVRALDLKTGGTNQSAVNAAASQEAALNQFVSIFKLQQNAYMSGSEQVSASIGFSWHVGEDRERKHAIFYYEDRGMGSDSITIAAKTNIELKVMEEVLIHTGLIPDPDEVKAKRAATAGKRNDALEKKGIKIGSKITADRIDNGEVWWSGVVTKISNSGTVEIAIEYIHPQMQTLKVGDKYKMKPGSISKSMVSNEN